MKKRNLFSFSLTLIACVVFALAGCNNTQGGGRRDVDCGTKIFGRRVAKYGAVVASNA